jgi:nucleoside-diphosphate-sugar epimerase
MKVLVTGHHGYIGAVMIDVLTQAGHDVTGLDTYFFSGCDFGPDRRVVKAVRKDVRDVESEDLVGFDAVIHLAALSNDPLGKLDEECTLDINHVASVKLAESTRAAGVSRFLFASSCSLYGASGDGILTEEAAFSPVTAYGRSKVLAETDISRLADDRFSPTFLRNATAYGVSPRLRADVVVNNFVGVAFTTGEVVIESDGSPWRPLVHVEDIARAFLAVLEAPREVIHNQAFNVGDTSENYKIRDVAAIVRDAVGGCTIRYREGGGPDPRCYRVNCDKLAEAIGFQTQWTVRKGVEDLHRAFVERGLTQETFSTYFRLTRIVEQLRGSELDSMLRWRTAPVAA